MKMSVRLIMVASLALLSAAALSASPFIFEPMLFPSARMAALGGMHAALADDISVLMSNPAGFRSAPPQISVAELTTNLSGPIFSIADVVFRIAGGTSPTSLLLEPDVQHLLTSLYTGATINRPIALGYIGEGLGFGFFNSTGMTFATEGTVPTVTTTLKEDILFVAGYGLRIPLPDRLQSTLDVGFSVKAFTRAGIEWSESILSFFSPHPPRVTCSTIPSRWTSYSVSMQARCTPGTRRSQWAWLPATCTHPWHGTPTPR